MTDRGVAALLRPAVQVRKTQPARWQKTIHKPRSLLPSRAYFARGEVFGKAICRSLHESQGRAGCPQRAVDVASVLSLLRRGGHRALPVRVWFRVQGNDLAFGEISRRSGKREQQTRRRISTRNVAKECACRLSVHGKDGVGAIGRTNGLFPKIPARSKKILIGGHVDAALLVI